MNRFLLKDNEIMIFTDFNNTLVDFENEYDFLTNRFDENFVPLPQITKINLTKCLRSFEKTTGLVPVLCIVTNASANAIDANNFKGISHDLHMTFFDHSFQSDQLAAESVKNSCEKYFRFLVYKENDAFFEINPLGKTQNEMFVRHEFSDEAKKIRLAPEFKKRESIERMLTVLDPMHSKMPYAIFAGDSIKDDYPMMLAKTSQGTSKIFIRPGKATRMKPSVVYEFCMAKGLEFSSVHPKTGKKIRQFDDNNIKFLNDADKDAYEHFSDEGTIILAPQNSRGLVEGLNKAAQMIAGWQQNLQMGQ